MGQSIDDILAEDDSPYVRAVIVDLPRAPQALWDEHARLEALLPTLTSDTIDAHPDREPTARRLVEIEAEMAAAAVRVKVSSIGHRAWADLLRKHPPTKDQLKVNRGLDHNPETFPEAAIAASASDPVMTVEQVTALVSKPWFNEQCWTRLWEACLRVNVVDDLPKSLAAGVILRQSGASGITAVNGESLVQSFLGVS